MCILTMCVLASVRRNRALRKATRSEIETVVKLWLRYALDRSGGRSVRSSVRRNITSARHSDTDISEG